jgi:plasmid stabilization system protein ParE
VKTRCELSGSAAAFYEASLQPARHQPSQLHPRVPERPQQRGARNVLTSIYAAVEFIRRHPDAAELTRIRAVRAKIVHKYRFKIFYRVIAEEDVIEIVHVRHTSRRPWIGE